jgi:hypothetical protein
MKKARISVFIAGVLVVAAAGVSFLFYDRYGSLEQGIEQERAESARRIRRLEGELELARAEISEYQEKLHAAGKIADDFQRELDARTRIVDESAARIEQLEAEIETLTAPQPPKEPAVAALTGNEAPDADKAAGGDRAPGGDQTPAGDEADGAGSAGRTSTASLGAVADESRSDLERELEEVRAEKRELEMKTAALAGEKAGGVPLGKVTVSTGLKLKGKVLVVNERYSFVVIDLGARDGVEKGMVLIVHRGRTFVGKCQVEKVYNRMAAADLVLDWMKDEVQVGDGVRKF